MMFNIDHITVEFIHCHLNSLPFLATRRQHYSLSYVVMARDTSTSFRTQSPPYVPPRGETVNPVPPPLGKQKMKYSRQIGLPSPQFSQGNGNQSYPEHNKKGALIPHSRSVSSCRQHTVYFEFLYKKF